MEVDEGGGEGGRRGRMQAVYKQQDWDMLYSMLKGE